MAASQRVSRGFHRLAVFLAAIPLVVGILGSIFIALDEANAAKRSQDEQLELICAQELAKAPTRRLLKPDEVIPLPPGKGPADVEWHNPPPDGLKAITYPEAKNPFDQFDEKYDLKELGCSEQSRKVSWHDMTDAPAPGVLNYAAALLPFLSYGFGISLGIAFALYGIVRAIGSPPTSESRFLRRDIPPVDAFSETPDANEPCPRPPYKIVADMLCVMTYHVHCMLSH